MPIDPVKDTLIGLDRGELLKIEKDTDHLWRPNPNSTNPVANLTLEGGGRCFYYHIEDGVWYCSEYFGSLKRVPEFKKKYKASEAESKEREVARQKWEQKMGGAAISVGVVNPTGAHGSLTAEPENAGAVSQGADHNMSIPQSGTTAMASQLESESSLATAQNQNEPYFPSGEIIDPPGFPIPTHFSADDVDMMRDELPDHRSHFPTTNVPQMSSFQPSFPFGPEGQPPLPTSSPFTFPFSSSNSSPQIPFFSPSFPFDSGVAVPPPPSPFPNYPSSPGEPSIAFANNPGILNGCIFIDGGCGEERVVNAGMSNSGGMAGHGMNFN